ncbi:MAG: hypothetical protein IJT97_03455 [Bacteroidaceae bacterium]|nr:hypothetical protein [Bacteroidaceae bacterium]
MALPLLWEKTPSVLRTSPPLWGEAIRMVSPSIEGGDRGGSVGVGEGVCVSLYWSSIQWTAWSVGWTF